MKPAIRLATHDDIDHLRHLIQVSARTLALPFYTHAQIEAALQSAWGVDTQLIRDRTFFIAEIQNTCAACGGWSWRKTLFGADTHHDREPAPLDPATDPARIRAFFVHPAFARRGLGQLLLHHCEAAARAGGFQSAELVATLPGEPLYRRFGYHELERIAHPLDHQLTIEFVRMRKDFPNRGL